MSRPPGMDEIEESVRSAREEALKPLPWPARDADRTRSQEPLAGGAVRYHYGSFFVDVAEDGRIIVSRKDWLSKYSLAIDGTLDVRGKFLRIVDGKAVSIDNENLIQTGEILIHQRTADLHRLNATFGERLTMQFPLRPSKPENRVDELIMRQQQILAGGLNRTIFTPIEKAAHNVDDEAVKRLVDYARSHFHNIESLSEQEKQDHFLTNSTATTAILLYEFATGTGPQYRRFDEKHAITHALIKARITDEILQSFSLDNAWATSVKQLVPIDVFRGYAFSPDQTSSAREFLEKHISSLQGVAAGNDIALFVGGASYTVSIDVPNESLTVLIRDSKSRSSLLLRQAIDRERIGFEKTPLGTTVQDYTFSIPIPWDLIHPSGT